MADPRDAYQADTPPPAETPMPGLPSEEATAAPLVPPRPPSPELAARLRAFEEAREVSEQRLDAAQVAGEELRRRQAERPDHAVGEELDGDVRVTVDGRGLLTDVRLGAGVGDVAPDQLGPLLLSAIQQAHQGLDRPTASPDAVTRLHDDRVAVALRALIEPTTTPAPEGPAS